MAVSKRLRYEVLRRDNHTCRYCGSAAPDVKLTVDHVLPVALGGSDEPTNLVAACADCNSGKTSSTPDAPLVADVEAKALLWDRALALAVERREARLEERQALFDYFETEWLGRYEISVPIGDDWKETVHRFYALGLRVAELDDAIDIAYQSPVKAANVWKYFCGVCWNKVRALEEDARQLIDTGAVSADD